MVSVIIPAYNSEKYLKQAVQSVLSQTYQNFEIILIDDKSTDNTLGISHFLANQDSRIHVLENPVNIGVAASRNKGMSACTGEYIAFLDSDDIWLPDKINLQMQKIREENLDLCCTAYSFINSETKPIGKTYRIPEVVSLKRLLAENVIGASTVVFRRSLALKFNMRTEYLHEDYVFWLELLQSGIHAAGINKPLTQYRKTEQGRSSNKKNAAHARYKIYRDFLGMSQIMSALYLTAYAFNGVKKHYL